MSKQNPVISVTGSSGAGTSFVKKAFEKIFDAKNINACIIEGDSFHKYERPEMKAEIAKSLANGERVLTHFSDKANHFDKLGELFDSYGKDGTGKKRYYIHSDEEAVEHNARLGTNLEPGQFTPWEDIESGTDIMFYEGLHGGVAEVADKVDLLVGVVPSINIEWIQKIYRDTTERPYSPADVHKAILDRMPDYAEFITPQFDRTHINFHRVPLIDTANPFDTNTAKPVPAPEDSLVVTTVRIDGVDLEGIKNQLPTDAMAFLQNENTLVYKGNYMVDVLDLMLSPIIENLVKNK
jgi:phosphoribulokinase